ncbi:MAG: Hsp70 family protein [Bacteroidota bacterium]
MTDRFYGIDFGTTNSVVSVYDSTTKKVTALLNNSIVPHPSVVWYKADGSVQVGHAAKNNLNRYSGIAGHHFISSIKRRLGQGEITTIFNEKRRSADIAAEIFKYLRTDAETRAGGFKLNSAIVTVPVYFNGQARRDLRTAANLSGIYIENFIHEPFAAIVGYVYGETGGVDLTSVRDQSILVFDWGGGTLDITLVHVDDKGFVEMANGGLSDRAGDHFDSILIKYVKTQVIEQLKITPSKLSILPGDADRLRTECERAKISLSKRDHEIIQVASAFNIDGKYYPIEVLLEREGLNELIRGDVQDAIAEIRRMLEEVNITSTNVDKVLLIGGTSKIPYVQDKLREIFGHRVVEVNNPDTIISEGASIISAEGLQPTLSRAIDVELSDKSYYTIFSEGEIASSAVMKKNICFYCTDNRDGEGKLVIAETVDKSANRRKVLDVLPIPVSRNLPKPYNHERVEVGFQLDDNLILQVIGKGATQEKSGNEEIINLHFGLLLSNKTGNGQK